MTDVNWVMKMQSAGEKIDLKIKQASFGARFKVSPVKFQDQMFSVFFCLWACMCEWEQNLSLEEVVSTSVISVKLNRLVYDDRCSTYKGAVLFSRMGTAR